MRPKAICGNRHGAERHELHRVMPQLVGLHGLEADTNEQIGSTEEVDDDRIAGHAGADPAEERVIFGQKAFGFWRHEHWDAERVNKGADRSGIAALIEVEAKNHDWPARARN